MAYITGIITLQVIFSLYWTAYCHWYQATIRDAVSVNVNKLLKCRTFRLGYHLFKCPNCSAMRLIPSRQSGQVSYQKNGPLYLFVAIVIEQWNWHLFVMVQRNLDYIQNLVLKLTIAFQNNNLAYFPTRVNK